MALEKCEKECNMLEVILIHDFCPLKIKINPNWFPYGFHLNGFHNHSTLITMLTVTRGNPLPAAPGPQSTYLTSSRNSSICFASLVSLTYCTAGSGVWLTVPYTTKPYWFGPYWYEDIKIKVGYKSIVGPQYNKGTREW